MKSSNFISPFYKSGKLFFSSVLIGIFLVFFSGFLFAQNNAQNIDPKKKIIVIDKEQFNAIRADEALYQKHQQGKSKELQKREIAYVETNTQKNDGNIVSEGKQLSNQYTKLDPLTLIPQKYHNHPEFNVVKLNKSPESVELIHLRDAQSRTFKNPDGSFTKQQAKSNMHFKDKNGRWRSVNGNLKRNDQKPNIYEINNTSKPISFNTGNGKIKMFLEENQSISFGDNIDLIITDNNLNEIDRTQAKLSGDHALKDNVISIKNVWNNIGRTQEFDHWYVKTNFIINSKPNYANNNGFLVFEDKIELPAGWTITESKEGIRTDNGWQGDLIIFNSSGNEVGRLLVPFYYDNQKKNTGAESCSSTEKSTIIGNNSGRGGDQSSLIGSYNIQKIGRGYKVSVLVPVSWLLDESRVYPVTIDPIASSTYSSGNIGSCMWTSYSITSMNVTIPAGATVTSTDSECQYRSWNGGWMSESYVTFKGDAGTDGWWRCNVDADGYCDVGPITHTIADGTYPTGVVPFEIWFTRTWGGSGCNTTYSYIVNNTWIETVTYTASICASSNDICTNAFTATLDGSCCSSTLDGTADNWTGSVGCQSGNNAEVWFQGTPSGSNNQLNFTVNNLGAGFGGNVELIFADGTCAGGFTVSSNCGPAPLSFSVAVTPGVTYYWTVSSSAGSNGANSTFDICVTEITASCTEGGGTYCAPTLGLQGSFLGSCMENTCTGTYYDDGGAAGVYSNDIGCCAGAGIYRTFCPDAAGQCVRATFTQFDVEDDPGGCYDFIEVNNGPTQNSTSLFAGCGDLSTQYTMAGAWGTGVFTSTDASGCLTFRFYSDASIPLAGWTVTLDCVPCAANTATDNNDCADLTQICSNTSFTGSAGGPGIISDGCGGCNLSENFTNWYGLTIQTSGDLYLTIDPIDNNDDYDFALYGPSPSCGALGSPVRCSYAANTGNTGMGNGATDFSEDVTGDAWVAPLSVTSGETYYLMINKWSAGGSGFSLDWTGSTASLQQVTANAGPDQNLCGVTTATLAGNTPNLGSGTWTVVSGTATITDINSPTSGVTGLVLGSSATLRWTIGDGSCTSNTDDVIITTNANPSTSAITGTTPVCEGATGITYSVTNTAGSSYSWTVPAGASITAGAGTASITVTFGASSGNVEVTETNAAGCVGSLVTYAVTVTPSDIYRSFTSGNWNVTGTWEFSCDGSTWYTATSSPDNTDGAVTILNTHTVTITSNPTIDQLVIDLGGTLNHQGSNDLTMADGSGVDLTVNGTFEDNVTSTYQITWLGSASWVMGANGTLIRTRTSSANDWRDNYDGGIINIPATAYWILRRSTGGPYVSSVGGMYYPNLTIENNTGTAWVVGGTSRFQGSSDYPRIKGNFDIGGSGTNTVDFLCDNTNANEVLVQGDLIIRNGSALRNYGTGFNIEGDLNVVGSGGNGITYDADGNRNLKFSGGNTQSILGAGTINVYAMEVDKSANDLTFSRAMIVDNQLTLTSGNILTTNTNLLTLIDNATSNAGSAGSFVDGPMKKIGNDVFVFPTGDGAKWARIAISAPANPNLLTEYTAEYFYAGYGDYTIAGGSDLNNISVVEYWTLDQAVNVGDDVRVRLYWENSVVSGITDCDGTPDDLRVAHWGAGAWNWNVDAVTLSGTCPTAGWVETNGNQPAYSPFTFSSKSAAVNPLPIELLYFTATYNSDTKHVDLDWVTSSEENNDYFTVEKSGDAKDFELVVQVPGAGTSNQTLYYEAVDKYPYEGVSYYRLKQTDYDGEYAYSNLVAVNVSKDLNFSVRPNPAKDNLEINFGNSSKGTVYTMNPDYDAEIRIYNTEGQIVYSKNFNGTFYKFSINISSFVKGMYIVTLSTNDELYKAKFVKE